MLRKVELLMLFDCCMSVNRSQTSSDCKGTSCTYSYLCATTKSSTDCKVHQLLCCCCPQSFKVRVRRAGSRYVTYFIVEGSGKCANWQFHCSISKHTKHAHSTTLASSISRASSTVFRCMWRRSAEMMTRPLILA